MSQSLEEKLEIVMKFFRGEKVQFKYKESHKWNDWELEYFKKFHLKEYEWRVKPQEKFMYFRVARVSGKTTPEIFIAKDDSFDYVENAVKYAYKKVDWLTDWTKYAVS